MLQTPAVDDHRLTALMEPFDSFWEAPHDIEKGYNSFGRFYKHNYRKHLPEDRDSRILVVSCGPGYFVNLLRQLGYQNVLGIDSFPDKIGYAEARNLPCKVQRAFPFLAGNREPFDVIFGEQELNHLTKSEILRFLELARGNLREGGTLIVHVINGANPLVGSESRAGNFDHYNSFTEYSLRQVLDYSGFVDVRMIPLKLYVFWHNPANYVAWFIDKVFNLFFRVYYRLVGKSASIYTKKLAAVAKKPDGESGGAEPIGESESGVAS
jgi:SAM-dependent methyltransferase